MPFPGFQKGYSTMNTITSKSPIDGAILGQIEATPVGAIGAICENAHVAHLSWRKVPAPRRGELVRIWGEVLRARKHEIADMVTLEAGKIISEALGEVQEMIDICDFAVGLSRQLHGLTIQSERPEHHLLERWKPLGVVGIISAFNFPVAVYAWNATLALICGNSIIWKPSEKTPLCAKIVQESLEEAAAKFGSDAPAHLFATIQGMADVGAAMVAHEKVRLVSATGSTRMGKQVARACAEGLKRSLLELGGNGAMIVRPSADFSLLGRAITFAAVGTAGQRCTTLRRLIVHSSVKAKLLEVLVKAYKSVPIGDPRKSGILMGPLIDKAAFEAMQTAISQAKSEGGTLVYGGERVGSGEGYYVTPAIIDMKTATSITATETFAPILYVVDADGLDEAIAINNDVPQGLSSAIFTNDLREAETFLSATGSDCGIANVNIGTSGAEIGGAFGGEKETGGGRESGSDAWKAYMVRQTQTINYSDVLPLAQGVKFDI